MAFNFDNVLEEKNVFNKGLTSKKILLYAVNDTGKTKQATKLPKPFLIMTEAGGSAINCPKEPCDDWRHFKEIVDDLTNSKNLVKRQEQQKVL